MPSWMTSYVCALTESIGGNESWYPSLSTSWRGVRGLHRCSHMLTGGITRRPQLSSSEWGHPQSYLAMLFQVWRTVTLSEIKARLEATTGRWSKKINMRRNSIWYEGMDELGDSRSRCSRLADVMRLEIKEHRQ